MKGAARAGRKRLTATPPLKKISRFFPRGGGHFSRLRDLLLLMGGLFFMSELFLLKGGIFPHGGPFFLMVSFFSYKKICVQSSPRAPSPPPNKMSHSPLSAPYFFKMSPPIFVYLRISLFTSISDHIFPPLICILSHGLLM